MSQIFDIGPSFYFMKSTKLSFIKWPKVTRFFFLHKMKSKALIENLRHGSLHKNVFEPC